jgi:hypothetical protein
MTAAGSPNECTFPAQQFTAADSNLFGQCQFTDVSQQELAFSDEVLAAAAARKDKLPVRNSVIQVGKRGILWALSVQEMKLLLRHKQQPSGNLVVAGGAGLAVAQQAVGDNCCRHWMLRIGAP